MTAKEVLIAFHAAFVARDVALSQSATGQALASARHYGRTSPPCAY